MNDEFINDAVARALALQSQWFPQTKEPVVTANKPLCGLGSDYEPFDLSDDDEVWIPRDPTPAYLDWLCANRDAEAVFPSKIDAEANGDPIKLVTLGNAKRAARSVGCATLRLLTGNLNVLNEWKV